MTTEKALDRIVNALRERGRAVRPTSGGNVKAQCPAHDDRNPSLSLRQIDGQALVKCFGPCATEDVMTALGLTMRDLFDEPQGARYVYTDAAGQATRTVHRSPDKQFRQSGDTKLKRLYRLPKVLAAVDAGQTVYLVEGEKDVHALESIGVVATTAPEGADRVSQVDVSPLKGARVVAVADRDAAGEKWAAAIHKRLGSSYAASLELVQAKDGKDAADHLLAGYGLDDFQPLLTLESDAVRNADDAPEQAKGQSDTSDTDTSRDDELLAAVRNGAWLDQQVFPDLRFAVDGVIPEGFTVLVGAPKVGKSWFIGGVLLAVAAGGYALGRIAMGKQRRVLYLALEDGDRRMQSRCRILLGDKVALPPLFHYVTRVPSNDVLATIDAFLRRYPDTALIVIDTLGKVMPQAHMGESAYQRDYRVGSRIKFIADANDGLAVVAIHHDRKAGSLDFVERVSGTNGLAGAADTIIVLDRSRQSVEGTLSVTGRDVMEAEYALVMEDGVSWTLDGHDLNAAADRARERAKDEEVARLSDTSVDVVRFVAAAGPDGVKAGDVVEKFGKDAYQYLKRLTSGDKPQLVKLGRGRYAAIHPTVSEVSERQKGSDEPASDTSDSPDTEAACVGCYAPTGRRDAAGDPRCDRCMPLDAGLFAAEPDDDKGTWDL